jgi:dTDP-4-dehydrorhamnose reductase
MTGILVFGSTGQVSTELKAFADIVAVGRDKVDLFDPAACAAAIEAYQPNFVINAAAYTSVDGAEKEEGLANIINGDSPAAMAKVCKMLNIPFVHISTDYVFSGIGNQAWFPKSITSPQNAYGRSKLVGEMGIRAVNGNYAILRTSWVFSAHSNNFVKTILRISKRQNELRVVNDQIGGPTPARAIAAACISIAKQLQDDPNKTGTYHFSGEPAVSFYEFAQAILKQARITTRVSPVSTKDQTALSVRPLNSVLNCHSTKHVFGILRPDWRLGLGETLKELEILI